LDSKQDFLLHFQKRVLEIFVSYPQMSFTTDLLHIL